MTEHGVCVGTVPGVVYSLVVVSWCLCALLFVVFDCVVYVCVVFCTVSCFRNCVVLMR